MPTTVSSIDHAKQLLIGNYSRLPVMMVRGEGSRIWDDQGNEYLDLFAGFGACILGHCHPDLVTAATEQAKQLWHVGNVFYTQPQVEFAERLNKTAFEGKAFFCHSGLEANEAAVKLARLRGQSASPKRWKIISMHHSFHGRSLAMIAATGNPAVKAGFEPAVPGFVQVEPGDLAAVEAAIDSETAGILVEPIQGEGGILPISPSYAAGLRQLCDQHHLTLIFDEVWTGCGRTGKWFAHQHFVLPDGSIVRPDIMTLGKAVGGGLPVGVMWATPPAADLLVPGKHGCTLGGNPICMAVAKTIFDVIERDDLVDYAAMLGQHGMARLKNEKSIATKIVGVRGKGLMIGIELRQPHTGVVEAGLKHGVVLNLTAKNVIRLAPPLNISKADWDQGIDRVIQTIASL